MTIYIPYAIRVANATMMSMFVLSMFSVLMPPMLLTGPMLSMLLLAFLSLKQLSILFYFLHMLLFAVLRTTRTACFDIRFGLCFGTFIGICQFYIRNIGEAIVASCHTAGCRWNGLTVWRNSLIACGTFVF